MSLSQEKTSSRDRARLSGTGRRIRWYAIATGIAWTVLSVVLLGVHTRDEYRHLREQARIQASSAYQKDVVYRRWNASKGGVYVPIGEESQPNPYLSHVPHRDVETTSGTKLTLINPAYMTRQVHEMTADDYGIRGHITSLNPIRPENKADEWETGALKEFEQGLFEKFEIIGIAGEPYARYMRPLVTEEQCLKCHAEQGYKLGDIRGGISATVPFAPLTTLFKKGFLGDFIEVGILYVFGLAGICIGYSKLQKVLAAQENAVARAEKNEEELLTAQRIASLGRWELNCRTNELEWPSATYEIFGAAPSTFNGTLDGFLARIHPDDRERVAEAYSESVKNHGEYNVTHRIITDDGSTRFINEICKTEYDDDGVAVKSIGTVQDITDRKRAEHALEDSERKYKGLVETSMDLIWECDVLGQFTYLNPAWTDATGYGLDEMMGHSFTEFLVPAEVEQCVAEFQSHMEGGFVKNFPCRYVHKNGKVLSMLFNASPLKGGSGEVAGTRGTAFDITDRVDAEKREADLREELMRAERMESLGLLAGGIAHDLNNVLGPMTVLPEILQEDLKTLIEEPSELADEMIDSLEIVKISAKRAATVVRDLVLLSRRGRYELIPLNINQAHCIAVDCEHSMVLSRRYPNVTLRRETAEEDLFVLGAEDHLARVVNNMLLNGAESIDGEGTVTVSTAKVTLAEPHEGYVTVPAGEYAVIRVSDTGSGIAAEDMQHIFEPFFTRKKKSNRSGSGLGLSVVHGILLDHDGFVDVSSTVGEGTTFTLYLPLAEAPDAASIVPERRDLPRGSEKVLVVDDEPAQRFTVTKTLSKLGYSVDEVDNGTDAAALFAAAHTKGESAPFHILVLDMIMDGIDGLDTYKQILDLYPDQKVIIASGHAEDHRATAATDLGAVWLAKPYEQADLAILVRERLDS